MWYLLLAVVLTILIETAYLFAVGYRDRMFVAACVLINFVTNVTLNVTLSLLPAAVRPGAVYPFEGAVVLVEWGVLGYFTGNRKRLLLHVFLSNLLSYLTGLVVFSFLK